MFTFPHGFLKLQGGGGGGPASYPVYESGEFSATTVHDASEYVAKPAGVEVGDLLVVIGFSSQDQTTDYFSPLGGFYRHTTGSYVTEFGDGNCNCRGVVYWRVADGTEAAGVTVKTIGTNSLCAMYLRFSGADHVNPFGIRANRNVAANENPHVAPSITTTTDNSLALGVILVKEPWQDLGTLSYNGTDWVFQGHCENRSSVGGGNSGFLLTKLQATAGATGDVEVAHTGGLQAAHYGAKMQLEMLPYSGPAPALPDPPVIESQQASSNETAPLTCVAPSGIATGDLLVIFASQGVAGTLTTAEAGWTREIHQAYGGSVVAMFWKISTDGSDGNVVIAGATGLPIAATYLRISNANSSPIGTSQVTGNSPSSPSYISYLAPLSAKSSLVFAAGQHDANNVNNTDYTLDDTYNGWTAGATVKTTNSASDACLGWGYKQMKLEVDLPGYARIVWPGGGTEGFSALMVEILAAT